MIDNPIKIPSGTIFICGPVGRDTDQSRDAFDKIEKKLKDLGHRCFNPLRNVETLDVKKRLAYLVMCDKIVTLKDWEFDDNCLNQVQVARILGKEVLMSEKYFFIDNIFHG